ncbi:MAG: helix-turn-helix domain-containing protein [Sneathiella sp.]
MALHEKINLKATLAIGVLSKKTKVNIETIRYYERIGVMPSPPRSAAGHRIYAPTHLRRLTFIKRSRELGFSLNEIRALLELVDGGDYTCDEIRAATLLHKEKILSRIKDLQRLEKTLTIMSDKCAGDTLPDCPIIDALYTEEDGSYSILDTAV